MSPEITEVKKDTQVKKIAEGVGISGDDSNYDQSPSPLCRAIGRGESLEDIQRLVEAGGSLLLTKFRVSPFMSHL